MGHVFGVTGMTKVTVAEKRACIKVRGICGRHVRGRLPSADDSFVLLLFSDVNPTSRFSASLAGGGNLAFLIVVVASYVSAATALIYSRSSLPGWEIAALAGAGGAYLLVGTYGFDACRRAGTRRAAAVYFIIQLLLAAILIRLRGSAGELSLILLPLAGQSALVLPPFWMVAVCFLTYVNLVLPLMLRSRWADAVAVALTYGTGIVFVVVFTRLAASEREARAELEEANRRLREHAAQVEELATTKERNRVGREIHDSLGHYLTVVNVQIGAAQALFAQDQARALDHLSKAQVLTQEGLAEVRRSVAALRSSPTDGRPLPAALGGLIEQWNAAVMNAIFEVVGTPRALTPQADITIYRAT